MQFHILSCSIYIESYIIESNTQIIHCQFIWTHLLKSLCWFRACHAVKCSSVLWKIKRQGKNIEVSLSCCWKYSGWSVNKKSPHLLQPDLYLVGLQMSLHSKGKTWLECLITSTFLAKVFSARERQLFQSVEWMCSKLQNYRMPGI